MLRDSLDGLSGSRHKGTDALSKRYKFRQTPNLHFLHHPVAMGLDGAFGTAYCAGGLLVGVTANDTLEHLSLARRQCRDMSANHIQLALQDSRHLMMRDRPLDRPKQIIRRYKLGQNVSRARLDGLYRDWDIEIASEENDWQRRTEFG
jgi:hypothetical protein